MIMGGIYFWKPQKQDPSFLKNQIQQIEKIDK